MIRLDGIDLKAITSFGKIFSNLIINNILFKKPMIQFDMIGLLNELAPTNEEEVMGEW